jgi:hypothetical protein
MREHRYLQGFLLAGLVLLVASTAVGAVPAMVRTTSGHVVDGSLSGIDPIIRLADVAPWVGPAKQYDIPLDSILQIWVEFPRIVIETVDHVFVGPYSAFTGIGEALSVDQRGVSERILTTAVDAVALNGTAFRPVPREWVGRGFLVLRKPTPLPGTATVATETATVKAIATASEDLAGETVVWNGLTPTMPAEEPADEVPWWVVVIGIGALFLIFFLLSGTQGGA